MPTGYHCGTVMQLNLDRAQTHTNKLAQLNATAKSIKKTAESIDATTDGLLNITMVVTGLWGSIFLCPPDKLITFKRVKFEGTAPSQSLPHVDV